MAIIDDEIIYDYRQGADYKVAGDDGVLHGLVLMDGKPPTPRVQSAAEEQFVLQVIKIRDRLCDRDSTFAQRIGISHTQWRNVLAGRKSLGLRFVAGCHNAFFPELAGAVIQFLRDFADQDEQIQWQRQLLSGVPHAPPEPPE